MVPVLKRFVTLTSCVIASASTIELETQIPVPLQPPGVVSPRCTYSVCCWGTGLVVVWISGGQSLGFVQSLTSFLAEVLEVLFTFTTTLFKSVLAKQTYTHTHRETGQQNTCKCYQRAHA